VADCDQGCEVDGVEVVIARTQAGAQLCAPPADAGALAHPTLPVPAAAPCQEEQRYVCAVGLVVECASGTSVALCMRGCYAEGASIDDDGVRREAAFAILCSR
jgi:hypothetical protein